MKLTLDKIQRIIKNYDELWLKALEVYKIMRECDPIQYPPLPTNYSILFNANICAQISFGEDTYDIPFHYLVVDEKPLKQLIINLRNERMNNEKEDYQRYLELKKKFEPLGSMRH